MLRSKSKSKSQVTCRRHNINIDVKVDPHRESGTAVKYIFGPIMAGVSRVSEKTIWFLEYCLAWGLDMSEKRRCDVPAGANLPAALREPFVSE